MLLVLLVHTCPSTGTSGKLLVMDDFRKVNSAVFAARAKWKPLGVELGLQIDDLDNMDKVQRGDTEACLGRMLKKWLETPSLKPTWASLVGALKAQTVGREDTAYTVGMYLHCIWAWCNFIISVTRALNWTFPIAWGYYFTRICHRYCDIFMEFSVLALDRVWKIFANIYWFLFLILGCILGYV